MTTPKLCLFTFVLAAGCVSTEPEDISVALTLDSENVRNLPVIASGETSLLGLDVPDSHGELAVRVTITGAASVRFRALTFQVDVDGQPLDVRMVRQRTPREPLQSGLTSSAIQDGDVLIFHYRARALNDLALPEGVPYGAGLSLSWDEDTLASIRETGTAVLDVADFVAAAVDTGSFALMPQPREVLEPDAVAGAQMRSAAELTSGLDVDVVDARVQVVYFGVDATIPGIGLALIDSPAVQIGGAPAGTVAPTDVLEVYSSDTPAASPATYDPAGTVALVGDVGGGKAVVTVELDYEPTDGTTGVTTDVIAYVADLP